MGDFKPRVRPGKTAPRLVRDLLDYDPRRPRPDVRNLLTDPAPIYRKTGKLYPLRTLPQDCQHKFCRKDEQSLLPRVDERPSTTSRYVSSSYCARCLYHFDVIADYTQRSGRETPCEQCTPFPFHHFQHCQTRNENLDDKETNPDKYDNFKEVHTFICSAPSCPVVVDVRISPPRLKKEHLSPVWDPAKVYKRGQKAIEDQPERYQDQRPQYPAEVLFLLRTYLSDALSKPPTMKKRINDRNKKFLLAFSDECDSLFKYLDFQIEFEDNTEGPGQDKYWVLPDVEPLSEDEFGLRTRRHFLEDVVYELSERISEGSANHLQQAQGRRLAFIHNAIPAMNDIYNTLGCLDYLKASRIVINLEEREHEHPHYAGLGAVNDFTDDLVAFAYDRQRDCDPANKPYYLECLQGIANGRHSIELQEKLVIAISMGENTLTEIDNAYKFLDINPDTKDGDEYIVGFYQSRIEAAPLQKEEARQCLFIIGQARKSERILSIANDKAMSVQEALDYLNVGHDTPSDSIEAVAITMAMDGDKAKVARALRVIAGHRNQSSLELFATNMESGDSSGAGAVTEAYRRLQIQDPNMRDESVISYYQTLCSNAPVGTKASYTEALQIIASARGSAMLRAYADNPNAPLQIEKGSEDQPVGLDNIGNTCYLNSLLQYYYTVKPVRDIVMNFSDYRMELNTENMLKKRVGGRAVARGEIIKAQKFVEELRELFESLKSAPTRSVRPTQDLAELTLFSTATEANFRRQSISSPAHPKVSSFLDPPMLGPELPPPPLRPPPRPNVNEDDIEMVDRPQQDGNNQDDASSDATLVDLDPPTSRDMNVDSSTKEEDTPSAAVGEHVAEAHVDEPEYLVVSANTTKTVTEPVADVSSQEIIDSQGDEVMVNGPTDTPAREPSPDKPPPVPPRNKPAPILTSAESEDSLRAQKLYFGAQQDVTEVIGNVMFRLQCAIKPTSIDPKFGEQIDKIRETFYGANAVYLKKAKAYDVKIEDWANIIVFPDSDGPRSIYEALDVVFDEQVVEIDNAFTTQYASISKLPPVFQTQIQRTAYDSKKQQASKNQNPIVFEETIFLDRYMDSEKVLQRRREAWKWKNRIRKLEARQKVLQSKPDGAVVNVPEALNATQHLIRMLEEQEVDGIVINPSLSEALEARRVEVMRELDAIDEEITTLKKKLQDQFTDMREHKYRLQAVFIHRGTSAYGHYWIYIYDFQHDIWREYNDERVSVVNDRKQVFEQSGASGPTPYYLVYVRDQDKDGLVDAVYRQIVEEHEQNEVIMIEDNSTEMENGVQHVEDINLIPTENSKTRDMMPNADLAGMGSWNLSQDGDW